MSHDISQTAEGLLLQVDSSPVALIRERGGCLDLVWQIRGPQDLATARRVLVGLIDLVITYESNPFQPKEKRR